ncbi:MAG: ECF transporter S component [Oscillospiraceae bacterium]|nr:ECF transporter S component [Oscillospiraceae bacterium]
MKNRSSIRNMTMAAVCVALCVVLPIAFHSIPDAGSVFLPMHIPVLICGMICGWPYGLLCGLMGPLVSSALTGMPPIAFLPAMMVECGTYGLVSGLMLKYVHTRSTYADLYIALVVAMIAGRVVSGIAKALIFTPGLALSAWVTASFVTALPGIIIQLVFLPSVVCTLMKAKVIPQRYAKGQITA